MSSMGLQARELNGSIMYSSGADALFSTYAAG